MNSECETERTTTQRDVKAVDVEEERRGRETPARQREVIMCAVLVLG